MNLASSGFRAPVISSRKMVGDNLRTVPTRLETLWTPYHRLSTDRDSEKYHRIICWNIYTFVIILFKTRIYMLEQSFC